MVRDDDIDALYDEPPERFTKSRDELAKRARSAGRTDLAIRIRALRKPSAVAWLANQLARRHPRETRALIDAAGEVRDAQADALRGKAGGALTPAMMRWRDAVRQLVRLGRELLVAEKRRPIDASRLGETLSGASVDPKRADRLARGVLGEEVAPPGFEALLGNDGDAAAPRSPARPAAKPKRTEPGKTAKSAEAAERRARARHEHARARAEAKDRKTRARRIAALRRDLAKADAAARAATRAAERARTAAARATTAAEEAAARAEARAARERELREEIRAAEESE